MEELNRLEEELGSVEDEGGPYHAGAEPEEDQIDSDEI